MFRGMNFAVDVQNFLRARDADVVDPPETEMSDPPNNLLVMPGTRVMEKLTESHLEHADVPGVHEERLAGREVVGDHLAGELDPCGALALELLEHEAVTAPHATWKLCCRPTLGVTPEVPHSQP